MTELNLSEQFKNLPPDKQAEILANYQQESSSASGVEKPVVKTENLKTTETTVTGVANLTEAEKLAVSGNIPSDRAINTISVDNAETILPQEDTTKFLGRNIEEADLIDAKGNPKMDLNAFLDNIQERVANPLNSDVDPKNRVN